jgi:hypothetical protein
LKDRTDQNTNLDVLWHERHEKVVYKEITFSELPVNDRVSMESIEDDIPQDLICKTTSGLNWDAFYSCRQESFGTAKQPKVAPWKEPGAFLSAKQRKGKAKGKGSKAKSPSRRRKTRKKTKRSSAREADDMIYGSGKGSGLQHMLSMVRQMDSTASSSMDNPFAAFTGAGKNKKPASRKKMCRFFRKGKCKFGEQCFNAHYMCQKDSPMDSSKNEPGPEASAGSKASGATSKPTSSPQSPRERSISYGRKSGSE